MLVGAGGACDGPLFLRALEGHGDALVLENRVHGDIDPLPTTFSRRTIILLLIVVDFVEGKGALALGSGGRVARRRAAAAGCQYSTGAPQAPRLVPEQPAIIRYNIQAILLSFPDY